MLHSTFGKFSFCGPTAIMATTSEDTSKVEQEVLCMRRGGGTTRSSAGYTYSGKDYLQVKGMWASEIQDVLEIMGYEVEVIEFWGDTPRKRPTLNQFVNDLADRGKWIVLIQGHFVAVEVGVMYKYFADTRHRDPIHFKDAPHKKARIQCAYRIVKKD